MTFNITLMLCKERGELPWPIKSSKIAFVNGKCKKKIVKDFKNYRTIISFYVRLLSLICDRLIPKMVAL